MLDINKGKKLTWPDFFRKIPPLWWSETSKIFQFFEKNILAKKFLNGPIRKVIMLKVKGDIYEGYRPNVSSVKKGCRSLRNFGPIVWNDMLPAKYLVQVLWHFYTIDFNSFILSISFYLKFGRKMGVNTGRGVVTGLWPRSCWMILTIFSS